MSTWSYQLNGIWLTVSYGVSVVSDLVSEAYMLDIVGLEVSKDLHLDIWVYLTIFMKNHSYSWRKP